MLRIQLHNPSHGYRKTVPLRHGHEKDYCTVHFSASWHLQWVKRDLDYYKNNNLIIKKDKTYGHWVNRCSASWARAFASTALAKRTFQFSTWRLKIKKYITLNFQKNCAWKPGRITHYNPGQELILTYGPVTCPLLGFIRS